MRAIELPTLLLAVVIYAAWAALTWSATALPAWLVLPLGAFVVAWHGSLQHEAVHNHPTPNSRANALIAGLPLWLWLPFGIYRDSHLAHHATDHLTDPTDDPESYYLSADAWHRAGPVTRAVLRVHNTLAGRLLIGPLVAMARLVGSEWRLLRAGNTEHLPYWAAHVVGVTLVLAWVVLVCDISVVQYVLLFAYPGLGLTLLRSFAEHRPNADQAQRTAIVEAHALLSLLFLHNNLHAVHHEHPQLPWYALPATYRADRAGTLARNGGYLVAGYAEWARRFGWRIKDEPAHPETDL